MKDLRMVTAGVTRSGGYNQEITTDNPELLGLWLIDTANKLSQDEKQIRGNWYIRAWTLSV